MFLCYNDRKPANTPVSILPVGRYIISCLCLTPWQSSGGVLIADQPRRNKSEKRRFAPKKPAQMVTTTAADGNLPSVSGKPGKFVGGLPMRGTAGGITEALELIFNTAWIGSIMGVALLH